MKLGVVVLNWNGKDVTPRCLESLLQSVCPADQIVVVDNASTDGSVELVRGRFPQVVLIENDANLGFAEGNNVGIRYLLERGFELVLILNNDTVVDVQCLCELKRAAQREPAAAYGATIYDLAAPEKIWYAGGTISRLTLDARHVTEAVGPKGAPRPTEFITGCCFMLRSEVLAEIGLLDCDFFAYYEDADWCLRASTAGKRLLYVPAAALQHEISHSFRRGKQRGVELARFAWARSQPVVLYLAYRNRLIIARRHARGELHLTSLVLRRLARAALHVALLLSTGRGLQARAIVDGSLDGVRGRTNASRSQRHLRVLSVSSLRR